MLNPLSSDLATLRQSLLFSGLEAVSYNINRKNSDLKLFEFGKTYHKYLNGFEEHKHLSLLISGNRNKETWTSAQKTTDFFLLKGYVKAILSRLGIEKFRMHQFNLIFFLKELQLRTTMIFWLKWALLKAYFEAFRY